MNVIDKNITSIKQLCEKHKVAKLYIFGSVLTDKFDQDSDIDLLVTFKPIKLEKYADNYFDFKFSLEDLLHRPIDLLEEKVIKNPFLKNSIDATKQVIYG